jgi:hypothetical protein
MPDDDDRDDAAAEVVCAGGVELPQIGASDGD